VLLAPHAPPPLMPLPAPPLVRLQVMYDASGVRLHAGKQASVLNMIITELPPDHPVSNSAGTLKDTLGHTPLQVAVGAVVGILTGYLVALLYL
jgi:acid phosphatase family membrane protein YuiD